MSIRLRRRKIAMRDEITSTTSKQLEVLPEDLDMDLPLAFTSGSEPIADLKVKLGIQRFPDGKEVRFEAFLNDSILHVFNLGAEALATPLLPPNSSTPLDRLRVKDRQSWTEPIQDLERPLRLLLQNGSSRHLSIEYVLAIKINTKWGIAPSLGATPRQLLESFGFSPAEFSLYRVNSADTLPPDTPLTLARGEMFEAQKDGRYGSINQISPSRGSQTIQQDVKLMSEAGVDTRLFTQGGQTYVEVCSLGIPNPPWSQQTTNIVIAIPSTYPAGGLYAFYMQQELRHVSGSIPGQQSSVIIDGRTWTLISWHYAPDRQWNPINDDLASHVAHCRGYFLQRGISR
jgi:E2/UBC family protein E